MRILAISDIHGHLNTFRNLLDTIALTKEDHLYLLGDFVNKGPDSRGVIQLILDLQQQGYHLSGVRGNHDEIWLNEADKGFMVLEPEYYTFLSHLPYFIEVPPFIFVHAGLNFLEANPLQDTASMTVIRNWRPLVKRSWLGDRIIVHGHIRRHRALIRLDMENRGPVIDIDNGCFSNSGLGQGSLCAVDLSNWNIWFERNVDLKRAF
ncbi:MAG: metallophosphoesterase [Bacteroidota bacterium]